MGIWIDRMHLAQLGWKTEMRVARHGLADKTDLNVGFWAHTWRWHNRVAEVKIHAHASCEANADKLMEVFDDLSAKVLEACERAWREYPDSVPCRMPDPLPDGRIALVLATHETKHFNLSQVREIEAERLTVPRRESRVYARTAAALSLIPGTDFEDEINPYARPSFVADTAPRFWQYEAFHRVFQRNDIRIKATRQLVRCEALDENVVAAVADAGCRSVLRMFDDYAPGGPRHGETENGLPPGYEVWPPIQAAPDPDEEADVEFEP